MSRRQGFCSDCGSSSDVRWTKKGWACTFCGEIIPDSVVDSDEDMKAEEEWEKNQVTVRLTAELLATGPECHMKLSTGCSCSRQICWSKGQCQAGIVGEGDSAAWMAPNEQFNSIGQMTVLDLHRSEWGYSEK